MMGADGRVDLAWCDEAQYKPIRREAASASLVIPRLPRRRVKPVDVRSRSCRLLSENLARSFSRVAFLGVAFCPRLLGCLGYRVR